MRNQLEARMSRRTFLKGTAGGGVGAFFSACLNGDNEQTPTAQVPPTFLPATDTPVSPTAILPTPTIEAIATQAATLQPSVTEAPTEFLPTETPSEFLITIVGLNFTCIDLMPYSRDRWREGVGDDEITSQVMKVKEAGATHIAIGTPYNSDPDKIDFIPFMKRWIKATRDTELKIWFRGNFCEFEYQDREKLPDQGWYEYRHTRQPEEHHGLIYNFITQHPELFESGDKFSPWPEPENGIMGDYYQNQQLYHDFLIKSHGNSTDAFRQIRKDVEVLFSFNGDVALKLDPEVVAGLGNIVAMDHHIDDPRKMSEYSDSMHQRFPNLRLVIGEYSAPRIKGQSQADQDRNQAAFGVEIFHQFDGKEIYGINYWPLKGGDKGLLNDDGTERPIYQDTKNQYIHLRPLSDNYHVE